MPFCQGCALAAHAGALEDGVATPAHAYPRVLRGVERAVRVMAAEDERRRTLYEAVAVLWQSAPTTSPVSIQGSLPSRDASCVRKVMLSHITGMSTKSPVPFGQT